MYDEFVYERVSFGGYRSPVLAGHLHLPFREEFTPPYPTVVVCHGLGSRKERHAKFAEFLSQRGFAALVLDLRGHGESQGELDGHEVDDFAAAVDYLSRRPEIDLDRLAVRGSSLGGHYAIQAGAALPAFRAVVAVCPATGAGLWAALMEQGAPGMIENDGLYARLKVPEYLDYLLRCDVFDAAARISPRALFLIHARGDETIPYQVSEELCARAGDPKRLLLLDGGSHTSAQHDEVVHMEVVEWLRLHFGM
ncbi:MAG: alpha/beta hydrolase [Chloroflexota bacterium]